MNAGKARDPKDRRRVLILMSDTGGGHRASAEVKLLLLDSFFDGNCRLFPNVIRQVMEFNMWMLPRRIDLQKEERLVCLFFNHSKDQKPHQSAGKTRICAIQILVECSERNPLWQG